MNKIFLGVDQHGSFIEAEVVDGLIRGFNGYDYINKSSSYDNIEYLYPHMWTHEVTIGDTKLVSGVKLPLKLPKVKIKDRRIFERAFRPDGGVFCNSCNMFHDNDQSDRASFVITDDGEPYCRTCVRSEDLLIEVTEAGDLFKAKDMTDTAKPKGYREVKTLFCDSSGLGSSSEAALTKNQTIDTAEKLLSKHGTLYAGLTGIGQFQVYVTLYVRSNSGRKAA